MLYIAPWKRLFKLRSSQNWAPVRKINEQNMSYGAACILNINSWCVHVLKIACWSGFLSQKRKREIPKEKKRPTIKSTRQLPYMRRWSSLTDFTLQETYLNHIPEFYITLSSAEKNADYLFCFLWCKESGYQTQFFNLKAFKKIQNCWTFFLHKQPVKSFNEFLAKAPWSTIRAKV